MIRGEPGNPEITVQSYIDTLLGEGFAELDEAPQELNSEAPQEEFVAAKSDVNTDGSALVNQLETLRQRNHKSNIPGNDSSDKPQQRALDARPAWGYSPVKCLLFAVGGLKLAIPTDRVSLHCPLDLQPLKDHETSLYAEHAMGYLRANPAEPDTKSKASAQFVPVLNTAKLIMPERYREALLDSYRHALLLKNADCCLAVDALVEEVSFEPQQVRWRSRHTRRQWLAGTVIERMCALLDVDALLDDLVADKILNDIGDK